MADLIPHADLKRLNMSNWGLHKVSINKPAPNFGDSFPLFTGAPELSAQLIPFTDEAIRQVQDLPDQCFMFGRYLWRIYQVQTACPTAGPITIEINCLAIWKDESAVSELEPAP